ncbi:hypothetical protein ACODYM_29275 [Burkholderia gladioli]|uniref:hypothetical protein n=1 Tax=Burkholderia gladioli TaxID=28095 RepID=UPI003B508A02
MSNTKNVRLGVCQVIYDGVDLGYTQGGVDVTVKTDTHQVNVDQFGKTPINEYLLGRSVEAKTPLAETTLDNLVAVMPGATMHVTGGTVATGSITIAQKPADGDTVTVNGFALTFRTNPLSATEVAIGTAVADAATNLASTLNNVEIDNRLNAATYAANAGVVTVTYGSKEVYGASGSPSVDGNAFTLAAGQASVTVSGATLTGGTNPSSRSVRVTTGIGTNLLDLARPLRLHPIDKPANDVSDDFVIPLAATPGQLSFSYTTDKERLYDVTFNGYPDPNTRLLFTVGE